MTEFVSKAEFHLLAAFLVGPTKNIFNCDMGLAFSVSPRHALLPRQLVNELLDAHGVIGTATPDIIVHGRIVSFGWSRFVEWLVVLTYQVASDQTAY